MSNHIFNYRDLFKTVTENSRIFIILFLGAILFHSTNITALAATFTVTNTNDDGEGSLRYAIAQANITEAEDTIVFDKRVFSTPKTITLTSGQLYPTYSLIIEGPGANLLTISGNNQSRIFFSNYPSYELTIKDVTLTEGFAPNGGAIYISNSLKVFDSVITGNKAAGAENSPAGFYAGLGGGIYTNSTTLIVNSVISNNMASGVVVQNTGNPNFGDFGTAGGGGGIFSQGNPVIVNCIFINNIAKGISGPTAGEGKSGTQGGWAYGGAVYGIFSFTIINSTFINNSAVAGNGGSVVSTVGVTAGEGGGAFGGAITSSGAKILNSTFNNNSAVAGNGGSSGHVNAVGKGGESRGGGIYDFSLYTANITLVDNSVIAGSGRFGGNGTGGGIFGGSSYQWRIINSTITGNKVTGGIGTESNGLSEGGGVFSRPDTSQGSAFHNNIVAENSAASGADIFGYYINPANNLIGKGEGAIGMMNGTNGNLVGTADSPINPMLAPLADNGGLTKTRALLSKSPAINAGKNASAINPVNSQTLQYDQRNLQRIFPASGVIDIGAFELGATSVPASAMPDLRNESDTGLTFEDNITKAAMPVFNVLNTIPGSRVELLRNNVVVASAIATSFSIFLTDPNAPTDATVQYTSRQTIDGVTSVGSDPLSVKFDHTPPTVTINQSADQSDPATNFPIRFTVVFSEPAGGLEREDISFEGSTADLSNAAIWINYVGNSTYTIEITGIRSPGVIIATIHAQAAYDPALNYSSASTSTDNSVNLQPNIIGVSLSGRIRKTSGLVRTSSTVTFTDTFTGETWTARTNPLGYYNFRGLPIYQHIGKRFAVRVSNKNFIYNAPLPITITGNRTNLNFTFP